nr:hypothetical protein [Tanacetum cinerariifolium]
MEEVLAKSPWIISNKPIFVQKWDPIIGMKKVDVTKIFVWVKLINIPMEAWSKEGISALASSLGKPLRMDNTTAQICKDGKGRAEYDRGTKKIKVEDLWKPNLCSQCKIFGHSDTRCRKNQNLNVERNQVAANSREHVGEENFTEVRHKRNNLVRNNDQAGYNQWKGEKRNVWNRNGGMEDRFNPSYEKNTMNNSTVVDNHNENEENVYEWANVAAKRCSANHVIGMDSSV